MVKNKCPATFAQQCKQMQTIENLQVKYAKMFSYSLQRMNECTPV